MNRLRAFAESVSARFTALSRREQRLVLAAAAAVAVFVLFLVGWSFSTQATSIRNRTASKAKSLAEIQAIAATYRQTETTRTELERRLRENAIHLASYLDELGKKSGLDIPTVDPKPDNVLEGNRVIERTVELTIKDAPLNRLADFLAGIEQGQDFVKVTYVRLEPRKDNGKESVMAWLRVASYHLKETP